MPGTPRTRESGGQGRGWIGGGEGGRSPSSEEKSCVSGTETDAPTPPTQLMILLQHASSKISGEGGAESVIQ